MKIKNILSLLAVTVFAGSINAAIPPTSVYAGSCIAATGSGYLDTRGFSSGGSTGSYPGTTLNGHPDVTVNYNLTGGNINNVGTVDNVGNVKPEFTALGFSSVATGGIIPSLWDRPGNGGSSNVEYVFDSATDHISIIILDVDESDRITVNAIDEDGNTVTDFSGWTTEAGDMTVSAGGLLDPAPNAVWDPVAHTVASGNLANANRSFMVLTPNQPLLSYSLDLDSDLGAGSIDPHAYYALYGGSGDCLSLGNLVWEDANNNGILDGSETGLSGVTVELYEDINSDGVYTLGTDILIDTTTTDASGSYLFAGLEAGEYLVALPSIDADTGRTLASSSGSNALQNGSFETAPDPDAADTDGDDNGTFDSSDSKVYSQAITLALGTEPINDGDVDADTNFSLDFGFYEPALLGNYVWYDTNGDGMQSPGETGVEGVTVSIFDAATDTLLTTQVTDATGQYLFGYLLPGSYYIQFSDLPDGYEVTSESTDDYSLIAGQSQLDVDGGIVLGADDAAPDTLADTGVNIVVNYLLGMALLAVAISAAVLPTRGE